ncbi:phage baseplate protein [Kingella bonacorsii]|mgnify:FL=1|uniref:Dit-like phage tail protein N-terminal domain-containing protein n=1 Tax=Kingella bonacorsii TaxID=2796361 RepID=A0ABS1BVG0_9NEIS|nr:hypothetical protein [Kingella bonacorsii]MBK0397263.1 hypothetical protein [Kingella bonacorsii]
MAWNSIGIPNIPKLPTNISGALIKFGGAALINAVFGNYWGIFGQNGIPLLLSDNVTSVKHQNTSKVSNAPIERGSFASYNKVGDPFTVTVQMSKGSGGVFARGAFLGLLDTLANSTDLFLVITPEAVYPNMAITGYDYAREASDGARLLKVNIHLAEVRQVEVKYTKTKPDGAQAQQDGGKVQPKPMQNNESVLSVVRGAAKDGLGRVADTVKKGFGLK